MTAPQVECDHTGAIRMRSWESRTYCRVCWEVQKWAEWFHIIGNLDDGGDE